MDLPPLPLIPAVNEILTEIYYLQADLAAMSAAIAELVKELSPEEKRNLAQRMAEVRETHLLKKAFSRRSKDSPEMS